MEQQVAQQQPGSGVDKALAPVVDLFFHWVLVLLYGSRLGETKTEKATRWGMVAVIAIAVIGGGVYLGTRKKGSGRRITRSSSRTTGPTRRATGGSGAREYPAGDPAGGTRPPGSAPRPGEPRSRPGRPTRPGDPAGRPRLPDAPPRRGSAPGGYAPRDRSGR